MHFCLISDTAIEIRPHLLRLIHYFCNNGWMADVVCVGGKGEIPEIQAGTSIHRSVHISRVKNSHKLAKKAGRFAEIIRLNSAIRSLNCGNWDIVFACHPYALLACRLAGLGKKEPLIYYSAELYDASRFWIQRAMERSSRKLLSGIVTSQEDRGHHMLKMLDMELPLLVVPNSCYDYLDEIQIQSPAIQTPEAPPIVFIYQGTSNLKRRCLRELVDVFGSIDADVLFKIALGGETKYIEELKVLIDGTRYPHHFELLDFVQYPEHFLATYRCHVGIMLYNENVSLNYRYCAPNKLYEYTMLGLPVISSDQPHLRREIEGHNFGICVDPLDRNAIADAVEAMTDLERLSEMGKNSRRWYERTGDYNIAGAQLVDWCSSLIHKKESL